MRLGHSLEQVVKMFGETPTSQLRKGREIVMKEEKKEKLVPESK
ncbi:hypothetical protein [Saccharolobus islandicus]